MSVLKLIVALCLVNTSLGIDEFVGKSKVAGSDRNYTTVKSERLTPVLEFEEDWTQWTTAHHKVYSDVRERTDKYSVWQANKEYIDQHNQNAQMLGYTLKMNKFGDLTTKEFIEGYHCVQDYQPTNASHLNQKHNTHAFVDFVRGGAGEGVSGGAGVRGGGDMPDTMDWRTSGIVTKVKDQHRCGSSYAFSAMASLEGLNALAYGSLVTLSVQNIVDCSVPYGNYGCACGDVNSALLYVIENDGVDTWWGYPSGGDPYRSKQYSCKYEKQYRGASARGVVSLASGDEETLLTAVANSGPVSVYVDATSTSFQFYSEGVLNSPYCSSSTLSHALVVIGYGTYNGQDYWLVKNSWGPNWGVRGYGMLARNKDNQCGIATAASFPTL